MIQVYLNAGIAYALNRALGVPHNVACPSGLIGASNFFELAVAAAIALFGFQSGAAWPVLDHGAVDDFVLLAEGRTDIGGAMLPPPEGVLGMPPDMPKALPGYDPDVQKSRAEARKLMEKSGYEPDKRLQIKVEHATSHSDMERQSGHPEGRPIRHS